MPDDSLTTIQPEVVAPATPTVDAPVTLDPGAVSGMTSEYMQAEAPVTPSESAVASAPVLEMPAAEVPIDSAPTTQDAAPTVVNLPTSPLAQAGSMPTVSPAPSVNLKSLLAKAMEIIRFRKNAKLEKIVKFAQEKGSITNDQAQTLLRISDATASRYLLELTRQGRLKRSGQGRGAKYLP